MFCVGIWDISATTNCKEVEYETHITAHYRLRHALRPQRLRQPGRLLFTRGRYSNRPPACTHRKLRPSSYACCMYFERLVIPGVPQP